MKKVLFTVLIPVLLVSFSFGQEKRFHLSFFGGVNHVFAYGSEDDYMMGENDFPITPAHTPLDLGAALAYLLTENLAVELRGDFTFNSMVTFLDPSDQDTVEINTSKHFSISLNLLYQLFKGKIRPYIVLGGGIDKIFAEEESYISSYGYEIEFGLLDRTIDLFANTGFGLYFWVAPLFDVKIETRYIFMFAESESIKSLNVVVGFMFRF